MKKLTIKQKKFADEYIISGNSTQAAINAGYSKKTARKIGSENLTKPDIKAYIDKQLTKLEDESIADAKEVMKYLTKAMRGETYDEVFYKSEFGGDKLGKVRIPSKDRIKAAELLGKRYQLFTDKVDMTLDVPTIISGADELED